MMDDREYEYDEEDESSPQKPNKETWDKVIEKNRRDRNRRKDERKRKERERRYE